MAEAKESRGAAQEKGFLRAFDIQITDSPEVFFQLAQKYGIPWTELRYIDLNRTSVGSN